MRRYWAFLLRNTRSLNGSFRKFGVPYLRGLIIRILLFRVLYYGPLFSETLKWHTLFRVPYDGFCILFLRTGGFC